MPNEIKDLKKKFETTTGLSFTKGLNISMMGTIITPANIIGMLIYQQVINLPEAQRYILWFIGTMIAVTFFAMVVYSLFESGRKALTEAGVKLSIILGFTGLTISILTSWLGRKAFGIQEVAGASVLDTTMQSSLSLQGGFIAVVIVSLVLLALGSKDK